MQRDYVDPVRDLEDSFLARLESVRSSLASSYPALEFNVWSSPTGSKTIYQGYDVGLECVFPNALDDQANCVAILIGVMHLTTAPLLSDAKVQWGAGASPDISMDLLPAPLLYTVEALEIISSRFDALVECFSRAVKSGPGYS